MAQAKKKKATGKKKTIAKKSTSIKKKNAARKVPGKTTKKTAPKKAVPDPDKLFKHLLASTRKTKKHLDLVSEIRKLEGCGAAFDARGESAVRLVLLALERLEKITASDLDYWPLRILVEGHMRRIMPFTEKDLTEFLTIIHKSEYNSAFIVVSMDAFIKNLENFAASQVPGPKLAALIEKYAQEGDSRQKSRLRKTLGKKTLYEMSSRDKFGMKVNADLKAMAAKEAAACANLLEQLAREGGKSSPAHKFEANVRPLLEALGLETHRECLRSWLTAAITVKARKEFYGDDEDEDFDEELLEDEYHEYRFIDNTGELKGLLWTSLFFEDQAVASLIAKLAVNSYKKIPGKGPASAMVGNACFHALGIMPGLFGVAQLTGLRYKIKQTSAVKLIERLIAESAAEKNIRPEDLEDIAVPDFGLADGALREELGDVEARVQAEAQGTVALKFFRDGKELKSPPAQVKKDYGEELKGLRELCKEIKDSLSVQKQRLDRFYTDGREYSPAEFEEKILGHGLLGLLAHKLIWEIEAGKETQAAMYRDEKWRDAQGDPIPHADKEKDNTRVRLWHPIGNRIREIQDWRDFMLEHSIQQPIKQAFREVYIITDAERNTGTYSNRFAGHVVKQHQFNMLAKTRGWKYSLLGAYDDGRDGEIARKALRAWNLEAQFWIEELPDEGESYNDAGIWLYVGTDQVRFTRSDDADETPLPLDEVPALAFSEIMRDADLFVGVASIGADPEWMDRGEAPRHQRYWRDYSFGELSESAKNRKELISALLPRLKIADSARLDGRFLKVKGNLREYKIHLGSGNILMEPNDEYLCIVPAASARTGERVFLPFEGDRLLSLILSKAFLLAEDEKITDGTILSQIKRA